MNEFDNFTPTKELTQEEKALKRCQEHLTELRKMESIDFAFGGMNNYEPRLSELDRKIQTQIYLQNVRATLKMNMEVEDLAKRICEMSKAYEDTVK